MKLEVFVVVKADGQIRRRTRKGHAGLYVYDTKAKAQNNCRVDGDSVVVSEIDLTREPIFIRRKVIV